MPLIRSARGRRRGPVEAVKRAAGAKEVWVPRLVLRPREGGRQFLFAVSGILGDRRNHRAVQSKICQIAVGQGVQFGQRLNIDPAALRHLLQLVPLMLHQIAKRPTGGTDSRIHKCHDGLNSFCSWGRFNCVCHLASAPTLFRVSANMGQMLHLHNDLPAQCCHAAIA